MQAKCEPRITDSAPFRTGPIGVGSTQANGTCPTQAKCEPRTTSPDLDQTDFTGACPRQAKCGPRIITPDLVQTDPSCAGSVQVKCKSGYPGYKHSCAAKVIQCLLPATEAKEQWKNIVGKKGEEPLWELPATLNQLAQIGIPIKLDGDVYIYDPLKNAIKLPGIAVFQPGNIHHVYVQQVLPEDICSSSWPIGLQGFRDAPCFMNDDDDEASPDAKRGERRGRQCRKTLANLTNNNIDVPCKSATQILRIVARNNDTIDSITKVIQEARASFEFAHFHVGYCQSNGKICGLRLIIGITSSEAPKN